LPVVPARVSAGQAGARVAGRCQRLPGRVPCLVDVAHNVDGARALAAMLAAERPEELPGESPGEPWTGRTLAVFGALDDKDLEGMVAAMADLVSVWYVAAPRAERAASAERLAAAVATSARAAARVLPDIATAWREAQRDAAPGDRVIVFGSFYTAAEILSLPANAATN
jgi:dihydrofolate synthase/folylpolyglutamate synthase